MFKSTVYISAIPEDARVDYVYPEERMDEILRCSNPRVRAEKYYAWKILQYAIAKHLNKNIEELSFFKDKNGKWHCDGCFFSISHSGGAVAVAISDKNIGVDIEAVHRCRDGMEKRILTDRERDLLYTSEAHRAEEYIIEKWSQKESIFKTLNKPVFEPAKLETCNFSVASHQLELNGETLVVSVCTEVIKDLTFTIIE